MKERADIREMVQQAYGTVARQQAGCGCKPKSCCGVPSPVEDVIMPQADLGLSCGDPVEYAKPSPGEVVVDLGSGAGRDAFIAAREVGPGGRVIGVDMTDDMLMLARANAVRFAAASGLANVEFRKGFIEELPVRDGEADAVISNCVINLSPDKPKVFREVYRALRPGGRMVVSDIVLEREMPPALKDNEALYAGCIAGALQRRDYLGAISAAGFRQVKVLKDVPHTPQGSISDPVIREVGDQLVGLASSLTILAVKD